MNKIRKMNKDNEMNKIRKRNTEMNKIRKINTENKIKKISFCVFIIYNILKK
tara:strand:- start:2069 stop:2224 length:156 start_codon:yes stop_codon:yes gene_type:complete